MVPQAGFWGIVVFSTPLIRTKYLCPDLMPVPADRLYLNEPLDAFLCLSSVIVLLSKQRT
jgi:hypothetical protein